jgi:CheY-like chemotaxis protein
MSLSDATVLIVDDEPILREIFSHWLQAVGCGQVCTATNGQGALDILATTPVQLLVTDIRMPIMDGVTLVRRLAAMGKPIPSIIFISAFGDFDLRELYALGVEAFISKPSDREELLAIMERCLAPRADLWLTPMRIPPRQSFEIEIEGEREAAASRFRLGRGGFCAHYSGPLTLGKVAFQCRLVAEGREMSGQGYVRWRSKADHMAGVEFAFLQETGRRWILEEIAATSPISYIPNLC